MLHDPWMQAETVPNKHLESTLQQIKRWNARRKFKGAQKEMNKGGVDWRKMMDDDKKKRKKKDKKKGSEKKKAKDREKQKAKKAKQKEKDKLKKKRE